MKNSDIFINKIREEAKKLGLFKIGFSKPEEIKKEGELFKKWIDDGFCSEMDWMKNNIEKRINPKILYPKVKTIISTAVNYFSDNRKKNMPETGKISRYAWGEDYHIIVREKLINLLDFIKKEYRNADGRIFVDSAPVMEKIWAVKSGIGWLGKNSLLITKEAGSWLFLGEIFLNIKLNSSKPFIQNHCGKCERCIKACPTEAIVKPGIINAERCISYQTIENKSEIPLNLRPHIGNWIYGCDICQEVCPWNKFSKVTTEKRFFPKKIDLDLKKIRKISEEEFQKKFWNSSIKRIKITKFKKNIKTAYDLLILKDDTAKNGFPPSRE